MELSPPYSESPPESSVAAACCDFTTCCYSGLCAVLCFTGVAITFIFSAAPDPSMELDGVAAPQTWLLGPVLILLSVLVAVKTLMHVRKQRLRMTGRRQRRRRRRHRPDSLDQGEVESGLELSLPPRGHDLPPSYEEVMKLMQEERRGAPPPPPPPPLPLPLPPPAEVVH